ncbi:MAG: hypothetical protein WD042_19045 [Phycisphaeraceae bacterium]
MTADKMRELWKAESFQPFTIRLADGRGIAVRHSEFMTVSPQGRTAVVFQPDGSMNIIDVMLVTDVEINTNGKPGGKKRR